MSNNLNQGLSQSDFRKLLQTPRVSANGDSIADDRSSSGHRRPGVLGKRRMQHRQQVVAKPTVVPADSTKRKKTSGNYNRHSSNQHQQQKYRDRAAERRQQDTTTGPAHGTSEVPSWSTGPMSASSEQHDPGTMSSEQRALYEQSKYLGGDLEHTHLVKGLDFLLLEKMRKRSAGRQPTAVNAENLDDELERLQQGCGEVSSSDSTDVALKTESAKATTQLGTRIMEVLQRMALEKQKWKQHAVEDGAAGSTRISTTRNELFKPGHMYFELDLSTDGIAAGSRPLVTVRLRGQEEIDQISGDAPAVGGDVREDSSDSHVVSRVISAISLAYQKRHDWHHLKEKDTVSEATQSQQGAQELGMRQEQSKKPLSPSKSQCSGGPEVEEEEDIFAEAGVDYEVTITAPETSDSDRRAIHTGPEVPSSLVLLNGGCDSDDEEMFVEPYPESPKESSDDDGAVVAPYLDSIDSKNLADTTQVAAVINPFGEYQSESESDNNSE